MRRVESDHLGRGSASALLGFAAWTRRALEIDVLRLLRSELSGPDIAGELVVSRKRRATHTKNIYTKLEVGNRRAAVRRADELGL